MYDEKFFRSVDKIFVQLRDESKFGNVDEVFVHFQGIIYRSRVFYIMKSIFYGEEYFGIVDKIFV